MNPIIPKTNATPGPGAPTELFLGELASNRSTGKLYLGTDSGIVEIVGGGGGVAGSIVSAFVGNGSTLAFFPISGYTDTTVGSYIVSVGGIDQRPTTDWTISSANSGTITFASAPPSGAAIIVRAFTGGSGGGTSGDATSLQGRALADTAPSDGQVIGWDDALQTWKPITVSGGGGGGTITFNTPGIHYFAVPSNARWAQMEAIGGTGGSGDPGGDGQNGSPAYQDENQIWRIGATGANGQNGVAQGAQGRSVKVNNQLVATGGAGGKGYGGGGGGGGARFDCLNEDGSPVGQSGNGATGNGPYAGQGGNGTTASNVTGANGANGGDGLGASGGIGGDGGYGGVGSASGGRGDLASGSGGGGGAGGWGPDYGGSTSSGGGGLGGKGGSGVGLSGQSVNAPFYLGAFAGGNLLIEITSGEGTASVTFTW